MAAPVPIIAQIVGMINRYFGNLELVSIKNPNVIIVVGQGNPNDIILSYDPTSK